MKRRNFFKIIAGGAAVAVLPKVAETEPTQKPHGFIKVGDEEIHELTSTKSGGADNDWDTDDTYSIDKTTLDIDGVRVVLDPSQHNTAEKVARAINEQPLGCTATVEDGNVVITTSNPVADASIVFNGPKD